MSIAHVQKRMAREFDAQIPQMSRTERIQKEQIRREWPGNEGTHSSFSTQDFLHGRETILTGGQGKRCTVHTVQ